MLKYAWPDIIKLQREMVISRTHVLVLAKTSFLFSFFLVIWYPRATEQRKGLSPDFSSYAKWDPRHLLGTHLKETRGGGPQGSISSTLSLPHPKIGWH